MSTEDTPKALTKSQWKKNRAHPGVTLPSGTVVTVQIPNLPTMVKSGQMPNELVEVATKVAATGSVPDDLMEQMEAFHKFLVAHTVVEPAITEEDVNDLPVEDIEMLVAFATRTRDLDAVGHHLAGLETVDSFRQFRELDTRGSDLLG